jgi:hypothetical protein
LLVVPVSVDDLAANGLLTATRPVAWARSVETLTARKDEIEGLALVSDEGIDAYVLYLKDPPELIAVRTVVEDDGARLARLLSHFAARAPRQMQLRKVHPEELPPSLAEQLGFRAVARHILHATIAGTA